MPAYGRWPVRRPVGLTRPAQSPEQPRKEYAGISDNEPISPACDPAIDRFPGALPDDGRSWAGTHPAPCRNRRRTVLPASSSRTIPRRVSSDRFLKSLRAVRGIIPPVRLRKAYARRQKKQPYIRKIECVKVSDDAVTLVYVHYFPGKIHVCYRDPT